MCGRFTLRTPQSILARQFAVGNIPQLPLRFNIAPSQDVLAIRNSEVGKRREAAMLEWGLIPSWSKDPDKGNRPINARAETVVAKPTFRAAFRRRRCLLPADGYYEWQPTADGKQPYYIKLADDAPFALAGLWERWSRDERAIESCTIITTASNELTRSIHQRMPVILPPEAYDVWLDADFADHAHLVSLLRPFASEAMRVHAVGRDVNRPTSDTPQCIATVTQGNASNDGDTSNDEAATDDEAAIAATDDDDAIEGRGGADGWLF